ncbi:unnamed protein product [Vitrella brassicaformis CCMP3155]|uniref:Sfi1 spindle body domain-containing protein n=1 Tax=Vitrella brassicaformis (strain CCMP3155) TaxID=1169540 RepID=A0A0G4EN91_VITBC|nr:unnamed protein product [Vitrella brassicaformis CCMP3155]|eukprot:CEL98591.1 unnamed protein product [Vitrella brassicaformis CCMP3155]
MGTSGRGADSGGEWVAASELDRVLADYETLRAQTSQHVEDLRRRQNALLEAAWADCEQLKQTLQDERIAAESKAALIESLRHEIMRLRTTTRDLHMEGSGSPSPRPSRPAAARARSLSPSERRRGVGVVGEERDYEQMKEDLSAMIRLNGEWMGKLLRLGAVVQCYQQWTQDIRQQVWSLHCLLTQQASIFTHPDDGEDDDDEGPDLSGSPPRPSSPCRSAPLPSSPVSILPLAEPSRSLSPSMERPRAAQRQGETERERERERRAFNPLEDLEHQPDPTPDVARGVAEILHTIRACRDGLQRLGERYQAAYLEATDNSQAHSRASNALMMHHCLSRIVDRHTATHRRDALGRLLACRDAHRTQQRRQARDHRNTAAALRMAQRGVMRRAWRTWMAARATHGRQRDAMRRMGTWLLHRRVTHAFCVWRLAVLRVAQGEGVQERAAVRRTEGMRLVRHLVRNREERTLRLAFEHWFRCTLLQKFDRLFTSFSAIRLIHAITNATKRAAARSGTAAIDAMRRRAAMHRAAAATAEGQMAREQQAGRAHLRAVKGRVFRAWRQVFVAIRRRQREQLMRIGGLLCRAVLRGAIHRMASGAHRVESAESADRLRAARQRDGARLLFGSIQRIHHDTVRQILQLSRRQLLREKRAKSLSALLHAAYLSRTRAALQALHLHMSRRRNASLVSMDRRMSLTEGQRAARAWRVAALRRAFGGWVEAVHRGRRQRDKIRKIVGVLYRRVVRDGFRRWVAAARCVGAQRAGLTRLCRQTLIRMHQSRMEQAFTALRTHAQRAHLSNRLIRMARTTSACRQLAHTLTAISRHRLVAPAWAHIKTHVMAHRRAHRAAGKHRVRVAKRAVWSAWLRYLSLTHAQKAQLTRLHNVCVRRLLRVGMGGMTTAARAREAQVLHEHVAVGRRARGGERLANLLRQRYRTRLLQAISQWQEASRTALHAHTARLVDRVARMGVNVSGRVAMDRQRALARETFIAWRDHTRLTRQRRQALERLGRVCRRVLHRAWWGFRANGYGCLAGRLTSRVAAVLHEAQAKDTMVRRGMAVRALSQAIMRCRRNITRASFDVWYTQRLRISMLTQGELLVRLGADMQTWQQRASDAERALQESLPIAQAIHSLAQPTLPAADDDTDGGGGHIVALREGRPPSPPPPAGRPGGRVEYVH